ncbi:MAG: glycosyl transferase family 2 [Anaerocolumna sp.]|jgi:glycosyltransferase involved in cell wall biosynthesis|nr:glycosyl transferase family 2 [Anaerocolumna sp.]
MKEGNYKNMLPLISIIVPIYNTAEYLNRCIKSICNQTYRNLEIILIDDGSTDLSPELCDNWAKRDSRIKVIHKTNGGFSDARNKGLNIAAGDLIGFVDSDDWIHTQMFEIMYNSLANIDADMAICKPKYLKEKFEGKIKTLIYQPDVREYTIDDTLKLIWNEEIPSCVWSLLCKKKLFNNLRFPLNRAYEDMWITPQLLLKCNPKTYIALVNEKLYNYIYYKKRAWHNNFYKNSTDLYENACQLSRIIKDNKPALIDYFNYYKVIILTDCYYKYLRSNNINKNYEEKIIEAFYEINKELKITLFIKSKYFIKIFLMYFHLMKLGVKVIKVIK